MGINWDTTWIGILGGGVSGSIIGGGSVYQIDLFHMGGTKQPVRVLVTGKRAGAVAELSSGHACLLVTGCKTATQMDGITSGGIDWEFSLGLKGSAVVKSGNKLFQALITAAKAAEGVSWAANETAKRFVQWVVGDLGVVQSGPQFNLLPTPLSLGIGVGIFYEWQTMNVMSGKLGWTYFSPTWALEHWKDKVRIHLMNIPETNGEQVKLGFAIPELGIDPFIRWSKVSGDAYVGRNDIQIIGYAQDGYLFDNRKRMGFAGIRISDFKPKGQNKAGVFTIDRNTKVKTKGYLTVKPVVFNFGNVEYWRAKTNVEMKVASDGRFVGYKGGDNERK